MFNMFKNDLCSKSTIFSISFFDIFNIEIDTYSNPVRYSFATGAQEHL